MCVCEPLVDDTAAACSPCSRTEISQLGSCVGGGCCREHGTFVCRHILDAAH